MSIKVIGAGLGRTGTTSFKRAMDMLGFGPCYHMVEVINNPTAIEFWRRAGEGDLGDLAVAFEGYQSSCDWPTARWYREQAERWPDAKVVLNVREPNAWFDSTQKTIFGQRTKPGAPGEGFADMLNAVVFKQLGDGRHDRAKAIAFFEAHNAEVKRTIPAERLLVHDSAEGWAPLCAFLGVPVPDAPYPLTNTTEEFVARIQAREAEHNG